MNRQKYFLPLWTLLLSLALSSFAWSASTYEQRFPDVMSAKVHRDAQGRYQFDVTVSSPYDTAARYADGFRVTTPDGTVLGERPLWHDHQHEQPFTRSLIGVSIPDTITKVVIQARDQKYGYGGKSVEIVLPKR